MQVKMIEIAEGQDAVAGSEEGAEALAKLIRQVSAIVDAGIVYLDFWGIEIATASWLRQAVVGFRDYCRGSRPNLYPAIANVNDKIVEELKVLLRSDAVIVCDLAKDGTPRNARVIGRLEQKQEETLAAVLEVRQVDAASMARIAGPDSGIGTTGWNNRLAALAGKGLLIESRRGRGKVYRPLFEELTYGS